MPEYFFDHIHLISPDPLKTSEFYKKMFGAKQVKVKDSGDGRVTVNLKIGDVTVLISKPASANAPTGLVHFGIRTNNLNKAVAEFKGKGVKFTREITKISPEFSISFLEAPENVSIELQEGTL
jgi:lactoylglutathione lyase